MKRRGIALFLSAVMLSASAGACHPIPLPDGGTEAGWVAAVDAIAAILEVILPLIRPLIMTTVPDGPAKQPVLTSLAAFEATAQAWVAGHTTWTLRGGPSCPAYSMTGALVVSTESLANSLALAGWGWGVDIGALLTSCDILMDRLLGACPTVDGGTLTASGRVGDTITAYLAGLHDPTGNPASRLQPLPSVR